MKLADLTPAQMSELLAIMQVRRDRAYDETAELAVPDAATVRDPMLARLDRIDAIRGKGERSIGRALETFAHGKDGKAACAHKADRAMKARVGYGQRVADRADSGALAVLRMGTKGSDKRNGKGVNRTIAAQAMSADLADRLRGTLARLDASERTANSGSSRAIRRAAKSKARAIRRDLGLTLATGNELADPTWESTIARVRASVA